MKRIIVLFLALSVLFLNTGLIVHAHYCMGDLVDIALADHHPTQDEHQCPKCGMQQKSSSGCCKDEHVVLKASDEARLASTAYHIPVLALAVLQYPYQDMLPPALVYKAQRFGGFQLLEPPRLSGPPLYIRHCVFLI